MQLRHAFRTRLRNSLIFSENVAAVNVAQRVIPAHANKQENIKHVLGARWKGAKTHRNETR
jgi:hypothetical protein